MPLAAVFASALFSLALLPAVAQSARDTARTYDLLADGMAAIGAPLDGARPVISDFPIWMAETQRIPTLALPDETPTDVLDLATDPRFDAALAHHRQARSWRLARRPGDVLGSRPRPASGR